MRIKAIEDKEILNVAITEATNEYIIMTDGDCIPNEKILLRFTPNMLKKVDFFPEDIVN